MGKKSGSASGCVLSQGLRDVVPLLASKVGDTFASFYKNSSFSIKLAQEEVFLN